MELEELIYEFRGTLTCDKNDKKSKKRWKLCSE
ncbi:hypothetical protein MAMMFC1_04192 [Methylomusa anaerophila]|uniref:Uncharacterized protein n=1 Tax=Methylomusa anaerophila TaxID=1930071 RepID=A0A348AQX7_9FIRM|nr:hypothetical protein MAMMFC1_04192 [Methylomusa anaerophila]